MLNVEFGNVISVSYSFTERRKEPGVTDISVDPDGRMRNWEMESASAQLP